MDPPHPTKEIRYENALIRVYTDGTIDRLMSPFVPPGPDPLTRTTSKDVVIDPATPVRARIYKPEPANNLPIPILVYFHGGGFIAETTFGSLYHPFLSALSAKADILIVSVEYRLAPENPIPAAYEDCLRSVLWVLSGSDDWVSGHGDTARIFLAGDSAGGNIAHNVALKAGEAGYGVEGVVLIHPYFWGTNKYPSERDPHAFLKPDQVDEMWTFICGTDEVSNDDPRANTLVEVDKWIGKMKCKRMLVAVAGKDIFRDRAKAYYDKLRDIEWSGSVEFFESKEKDHVFFLFNPGCERASEFMNALVDFFTNDQIKVGKI